MTRMLLDLITVTKQVDNEEMLEEQDDKDIKAGNKLGKMAALQVEVLSATVTDELSSLYVISYHTLYCSIHYIVYYKTFS